MISCNIIRDLQLLYEADECSEDSKKLIEEHLKTCEKCRNNLETSRIPSLPPENAVNRITLDEKARDFNARKGFRKIRRRWFISLLCVLMIFPLIGTGFLIRNQIKGDGVSFANLDEIYITNRFLKAIQSKDYNKAFTYLNVEGMYEDMIKNQVEDLYDWDSEYSEVKVGGRSWYVNREVYLNDYQAYLSSGDEAAFWENMMIYNSEHRGNTAIPQEQFTAAAALFNKERNTQVHVAMDSSIYDDGYYYTEFISEDGSIYYYPATGGHFVYEDETLMNGSYSIPASVYEKQMVTIKQEHAKVKGCANYYKELGLEAYKEMLKKEFLTNMQKLEDLGITIESFSLHNIVKGGNETGEWQVDINLICRQGGNRSTSGGIIAFVRNGSLMVSGGFASTTSDNGILDMVMELLSPGEDVSNYYG